MVTGDNGAGTVDYEPNSFGGPVEDQSIKEPPIRINGDADRYVTYLRDDTDYYAQPRAFWEKVLDDVGRDHLVQNIVGSMTNPSMGMEDDAKMHEIQQRMLKHWYKVHRDFGAAVEKGISKAEMKQAAE